MLKNPVDGTIRGHFRDIPVAAPFTSLMALGILLVRTRASSQFPPKASDWNVECRRTGMLPHSLMHRLSRATRTPPQRFDKDFSAGFRSLSLEVSLKADVRRLLQALTVPEYVEAWIAIPGEMPGCSTVVTGNHEGYAIEHYCSGRPSVLISGCYCPSRRRRVAFSWSVEGDLSVRETEVEIRLRGDFERTALQLRHAGFASRSDCEWHTALWSGSMDRLAALYETPHRTLDRRGSQSAKIP